MQGIIAQYLSIKTHFLLNLVLQGSNECDTLITWTQPCEKIWTKNRRSSLVFQIEDEMVHIYLHIISFA